MSYVQGQLPAGERSAQQASRPMLVKLNVLDDQQNQAEWRTTGSWASGSDLTDSDFPTTRLNDGRVHLVTKPTDVATATYYVMLDLTVGTTDAYTVDFCSVHGHNFGDLPGNITCTLQIDNNSDFSTPVTLGVYASVADNKAFAFTQIGVAPDSNFYTYTSVRYLRLKIETDAGDVGIPEIGQLVIGKARRLSQGPTRPWDPDGTESDVADFSPKGGQGVRYTRSYGQAVLRSIQWQATGTDLYSLDDVATLKSWRDDTNHLSTPFVYVVDPRSVSAAVSDQVYFFQVRSPGFRSAYIGPAERRIGPFDFEELAPFRALAG